MVNGLGPNIRASIGLDLVQCKGWINETGGRSSCTFYLIHSSEGKLFMALQTPSIFVPLNSSQLPKLSKQCIATYSNKHSLTRRRDRYGVCFSSTSNDDGEAQPSTNSAEEYLKSQATNKLKVGSPIIVTEAPRWIKTATAMPSLRVNSGHINAGDVGRIMSRKPKDVWAVRFRIGTYLIDGKYFEALELDEPVA